MRNERILSHVDLARVGLEIGPLTTPILTKDQATIYYADHMSVKELKAKYSKEPVELDKIVPIDYVLGGKTLKATVGKRRFDYVLASHVIEHVPDMVTWLKDVASVLKPGGVLSLVIPDKRFTFDINRRDSSAADVVGAYLDKIPRPSSATMYDFASEYRADVKASEVWANPLADYTQKKRRYTQEEALEMCRTNHKEYVDCHSWVFTPYSFLELVKALIELDLFDFEIVGFFNTAKDELEFFVSLQKSDRSRSVKLKSVPYLERHQSRSELEKQVGQLQSQVSDILNSTSWKVTKPIRSLKSLLSKRPVD